MLGADPEDQAQRVLPPPELREWLLDELAELAEQRGVDPLVNAPLLQPSPEFFPDPWRGDVASVRRVLRRLFRYARIDTSAIEVVSYDPDDEKQPDEPPPPPLRGQVPPVWLMPARPGAPWRFGLNVTTLDDPVHLVAGCARAVAAAYRQHHDLPDRADEGREPTIDVTAVYLGFGILTVDASLRFQSGAQGGFRATRRQTRIGALSPQAIAWLLGAQALLRGLAPKQRRKLASRLQPNQAEFFRQAVKKLEGTDLIGRLELPPEDTWPDPPDRGWYVAPLDDEPAVEADTEAAEATPAAAQRDSIRDKNRGKPVFRVEKNMIGTLLKATVIPTVFLGGMLTRPFMQLPITSTHVTFAALGMAALSVLVGALLKDSRCSEPKCMARLTSEMETCPVCGGTIMGVIGSAKERLEAEERLADEGRLPAASDGA